MFAWGIGSFFTNSAIMVAALKYLSGEDLLLCV